MPALLSSPAARQSSLGLLVPRRIARDRGLVSTATAAYLLGVDFQTVIDLVNPVAPLARPSLCWVFNVAVNGEGAEAAWRYWPRELEAFEFPPARRAVQAMLWERVAVSILPPKETFTSQDVECILNCSQATVSRLEDKHHLPRNAAGRFLRQGVEKFLNTRLLHAACFK